MSKKYAKKRKQEKKNKQTMQIAGGVLLLLIISIIGLNNTQTAVAINVDQAHQLREEGALILDVREQFEWDENHIPGATLIPLGELSNRLNELPTDQEIVVVCRSGNRSLTGRDILLKAGFENVVSMNGGMNDWTASGYETVSGP